ncbi:MAG: HAMP domain-containing histidine kinase [Phycisphaerae bacterium]|nr:HAMP domain-containing histidine kinase [Phycisphaerae bacterium]
MRVRKKVLTLHTVFSLAAAIVLVVPLRPAISDVVEKAEFTEARALLRVLLADPTSETTTWSRVAPEADVRRGSAQELGLPESIASAARAQPRTPVNMHGDDGSVGATACVPGPEGESFVRVMVRIPEARQAVWQLYGLTAVALLAIYALVAAALELFILPQHVYEPISRMLDADAAVREGNAAEEMIPERLIPADELGELMRSRNAAVMALRRQERALAEALGELERVATDLKRKNHLLETARRNLADADRLASLGMMSAGIAHELNTPLAVAKGMAERLNASPKRSLDEADAALLLRVLTRLERLGESLLDFARVRPPQTRPTPVRALVDEAITLVRLDRDARGARFVNRVPESLVIECDGDRLVQVLVNILRNAADASPAGATIDAETTERDGRPWASISIADEGPGIDPEVRSRLFEPFASTKLDSRGTGLGLAVAEGIVREHGGLILARNREGVHGAVFEIMLPAIAPEPAHA